MNRTITITHSHSRYAHPVFERQYGLVLDASDFHDSPGVSRQTQFARFRGAGLDEDVAPVRYDPVFTPPRPRLRKSKEKMAAILAALAALHLLTYSAFVMVTYKREAKSGSAPARVQRELRLLDENESRKRLR